MKYPSNVSSKDRLWVRFKQVDFKLDSHNRLKVKGNDTPAVYLHMPGSFSFGDGATYTSSDFGMIGRGVEQAIQGGVLGGVGDLESRLSDAGAMLSGALVDTIQQGQNLVGGNAVNAAVITMVMQRFPGLSASPAGNAVRGNLRYTANPHQRAIFERVGIRTFKWDFELIPDDSNEASEINDIVKFFRRNLYPEYVPGALGSSELAVAADDYVYKFPSMLKIDMFYQMADETRDAISQAGDITDILTTTLGGDRDDLVSSGLLRIGPRLQYCSLVSVDTTLDSGNAMTYRTDSQGRAAPLATKLSVSVTEDRTLHRGMIDQGF